MAASPIHSAREDFQTLRPFLSASQADAIRKGLSGADSSYFSRKFREYSDRVRKMPVTYQQDGKGDAAIVHLHYFKGGCDWYITEKDMDGSGTTQAFGYACMGSPELGYISIAELVRNGAELDLNWTPKTLGEVKLSRNN